MFTVSYTLNVVCQLYFNLKKKKKLKRQKKKLINWTASKLEILVLQMALLKSEKSGRKYSQSGSHKDLVIKVVYEELLPFNNTSNF